MFIPKKCFIISLCEHMTLSEILQTHLESLSLSESVSEMCNDIHISICTNTSNKVIEFYRHLSIMESLPSGTGNLEVNFIRKQHSNNI